MAFECDVADLGVDLGFKAPPQPPIYQGVEYFSKESQQQIPALNTFQRKMCCWDLIFSHRHRTNVKLKSGLDQQGRASRTEGFMLDFGRYLK